MHKLTRGAEPECLCNWDYRVHTWRKFGEDAPDDKDSVRQALCSMQGDRCAYCEGPLYGSKRHIEHFRRKNSAHFPHLTFDWHNLFLSCEEQVHCGHYKDRPSGDPYLPEDLIKPDVDDPDDFLYVHSRGDVQCRTGVSATNQHRAAETVRVFNLNEPSLQAARRRAIDQYERPNPGIIDILRTWKTPDRQAYVQSELTATANDPYSTTIKHFLQKCI
jgi:uncharacterized protein (TIGR02646 family)